MTDETGARSDWLEAEELRAVHRACPEEARRDLGLELVESEDAVVSFARNEASILWNRALIHGAARPAPLGAVREVVREFAARGIADYFVQLNRRTLEATDADLAGLGLVKARAWQRFERGNAPPPVPKTTLVVRRLREPGPELSRAFAEIVVAGFGLEARVLPLFEAVARSDAWMSFMSFAGDEPAGVGALLVRRDLRSGELLGWLDMGATALRFRGRGGQQSGPLRAHRSRSRDRLYASVHRNGGSGAGRSATLVSQHPARGLLAHRVARELAPESAPIRSVKRVLWRACAGLHS